MHDPTMELQGLRSVDLWTAELRLRMVVVHSLRLGIGPLPLHGSLDLEKLEEFYTFDKCGVT